VVKISGMKHLIITIDLPVSEKVGDLTEEEAQRAANEAYKAARSAIIHWIRYDKDDFTFKIEK